jgi:hypothetical protein
MDRAQPLINSLCSLQGARIAPERMPANKEFLHGDGRKFLTRFINI